MRKPRDRNSEMNQESNGASLEHYNIFDSVYMVLLYDDEAILDRQKFDYFHVESMCANPRLKSDVGPCNLRQIFQFCQFLHTQLQIAKKSIALTISSNNQMLTQALFLVGSYMIMILGIDDNAVTERMEIFEPTTLSFTDTSDKEKSCDKVLSIQDCFRALVKARDLKWVDFSQGGVDPVSLGTGFDSEEYAHLDNPLNADVHEVIPGKFLIVRGPRDLPGGSLWHDVHRANGTFSHRDFSPQHYAPILLQFDVQAIVRCNTPQYDRGGFEDAGIAVVDLVHESGASPPIDIAAKFLAIAEILPGAVAVHCTSGLGRAGTLVGLYLMKHHGFTAGEAIGWLRIVRPGSLFGAQQDYLCAKEAIMHRSGDAFRALIKRPPPAVSAPPEGLSAVQRAIAAATRTVDGKHAAVRATLAAAFRPGATTLPADSDRGNPAVAGPRSLSLDSATAADSEAGRPHADQAPGRARSVGSACGRLREGGPDSDSEGPDEEWHLPTEFRGAAGRQLRRGTSAEGQGGASAAAAAAAGRRRRRALAELPGVRPAAGRRGRTGRPESPTP